jgi:preprotein translocase subunit SecG
VIHLLIVLALVGVVLMQRSEGGGLGIGGGSGFMTARGAANVLTRATAILATGFFITSLALGIISRYGDNPTDILNRISTTPGTRPAGNLPAGQLPPTSGGILNQLGGPSSQTPAPASDIPGTAPASDIPGTQPATGGTAAPGTTTPAPATNSPAAPATPPATTVPAPTAPVTPAQPSSPVPN